MVMLSSSQISILHWRTSSSKQKNCGNLSLGNVSLSLKFTAPKLRGRLKLLEQVKMLN